MSPDEYNSTEVSDIESIGKARAASLAEVGIYSISDLLRVSAPHLHQALSEKTDLSKEQVAAWRQMSFLLAVHDVTPQWAEGLYKAGVESIEELSRSGIEELNELFSLAKEKRIIPEVPSLEQCSSMIQDATVLHYTGWLGGTVYDKSGEPVEGAEVKLGNYTASTDKRGRFRLWRIGMNSSAKLVIHHSQKGSIGIEQPKINFDTSVVAYHRYELVSDDTGLEPINFSEYSGDTLPSLTGLPVKRESLDAGGLREGDILLLRKYYKRGEDVQLVSRFRDVIADKVVIYTFRLANSKLPDQAEIGDNFRVVNGELAPIKMNLRKLHRNKLMRRFNKQFPGHKKPTTTSELNQWLADVSEFSRN